MSYDARSSKLAIGDRVLIPGIITGLAPTDDNVNCAVDLQYPMPTDKTTTILHLNTAQVEKADDQPTEKINFKRPVPTVQPSGALA